MGKRTKFQIKELAQLTLNVNSPRTENSIHFLPTQCSHLPEVSK